MVDSNILITLSNEDFEHLNKSKLDLEIFKKIRNENTYKYINNPDNKEKLKQARREYARRNYEKLKNDEEFMKKKREDALKNYYKRKLLKNI